MIFAHTNLSKFELCPKQFKHLYILKDIPKEAPSPALKEGREAHSAFEARLKHGTPLQGHLAAFEPYVLSIEGKAKQPQAELELAMTATGQPTGFWQKDAWLRGKIDVSVLVEDRGLILDWKTGKRREDPDELEIFGLLYKTNFPLVKQVSGAYIWLKEAKVGQVYDLSLSEEKLAQVRKRAERVEEAIKANFFPPIQNPLCGWCSVKTCQFHPRGD